MDTLWHILRYFKETILDKKIKFIRIQDIQPVHPKGDQFWVFIGGTDAEAETPILWSPDVKIHWKRPWCWERLKAG